jgi:hypothetical protein
MLLGEVYAIENQSIFHWSIDQSEMNLEAKPMDVGVVVGGGFPRTHKNTKPPS